LGSTDVRAGEATDDLMNGARLFDKKGQANPVPLEAAMDGFG
jgi:hypothetical protein